MHPPVFLIKAFTVLEGCLPGPHHAVGILGMQGLYPVEIQSRLRGHSHQLRAFPVDVNRPSVGVIQIQSDGGMVREGSEQALLTVQACLNILDVLPQQRERIHRDSTFGLRAHVCLQGCCEIQLWDKTSSMVQE